MIILRLEFEVESMWRVWLLEICFRNGVINKSWLLRKFEYWRVVRGEGVEEYKCGIRGLEFLVMGFWIGSIWECGCWL